MIESETHHLKLEEKYFSRIVNAQKSFEIRKNDRDYQVGDYIIFRLVFTENDEVVELGEQSPLYKIIYIHTGFGMQDGYVVLGIELDKEEGVE